MTRYTALTVRIMSSWKILAGLSLGVAALLTFRFNRQLRKQNHDLEGKLRTQSEQLLELESLRQLLNDLEGTLRTQSEQLEGCQGELRTLEVELRTRSNENYGLSIELRHRSEQLGILQVEFLG